MPYRDIPMVIIILASVYLLSVYILLILAQRATGSVEPSCKGPADFSAKSFSAEEALSSKPPASKVP